MDSSSSVATCDSTVATTPSHLPLVSRAPVDWSTLAVEEGSSPSDYWTPRQCVEHVVGGGSVATQWLGLGTMPSVCVRTHVRENTRAWAELSIESVVDCSRLHRPHSSQKQPYVMVKQECCVLSLPPCPPFQDGCQLSDHCITVVDGAAGASDVGAVLLAHQDMICIQDTETAGDRARCVSKP